MHDQKELEKRARETIENEIVKWDRERLEKNDKWNHERLEKNDKWNMESCEDQRKQLSRLADAFEGILKEVKQIRQTFDGMLFDGEIKVTLKGDD